jgi:hypothetical protein
VKRLAVASVALAGAASAVVAWAGFAPLSVASRDEPFVIPKGTWARRMAGNKVEILPPRIDLTLGLNDQLLLRNLDDVPQQFGPVLVMPGQSFRLPFERAATYSFDCTAHASGQMTIVVAEAPATPWERIDWRWHQWMKKTRA